MVEVFKTNVEENELAEELVATLNDHFPYSRINFDLQDCDRILRIEGSEICCEIIIELMKTRGFACELLG